MKKIVTIFLLITSFWAQAQNITIYYTPVKMPAQLHNDYFENFDTKTLAEDLAQLLCCATGKTYKTAPYDSESKGGIFLLLDPSLRDSTNETGHIAITPNTIVIRSKYVTGISFALYSWLQDLGFRFYLPGDAWAYFPKIKSLFQPLKKIYQPHFKLRLLNSSGGLFPVPGIDDSGMIKRKWETWYRRNRMGSDYMRIDGHKGELFNIVHKKELEADPAILAPFEGKRKYAVGAKLDPTYKKGVELFTSWLGKEFAQAQKSMPGFLPFKKFQSADMGDGLNYCHTVACEERFHSVSDQAFYLTNEAAKEIRKQFPDAGVSTLAYTERADTPSIKIEPNVHVMVVPGAFQQAGLPSDLMQRWVRKHPVISQYDFINIGVWHYDHPFFNLDNYHDYLQWMKELQIDGMSLETSMSSMASGVQQYFIMKYLAEPFDNLNAEFDRFCDLMFGKASAPVRRMLKQWYFSDVHLKTSLEKPSFYPDELASFIHNIRQAENTSGLSKEERERIRQLKAYIVYLCSFYELYHEPQRERPENLNMKAEALLNLTWGLYHHNIFHNTQLNDLIRKSTVDAAQWDFRKGSRVKAAKAISWTQIEKMFAVYEAKYGNYLSEMVELTVTNKRYLARFSADSIRIVTMDEKSFGSFNYPLKVYSPSKGIIRIRYSTGKGVDRKRAEEELSVVALEKGGKLLQKHSIISNNDTAWVEFSIPHEGDYTLQLAQFHATPVEWVIFPTGNLVYIEKKQLIHHGIRLMEEKGSAYSNTQLAVWNNFKPFAFQPLFENVRNTVSFHSSEGHPLATSLHTSRNQFQVVPTKTLQPFSFYRNDVMRWPVVLQNLPPYFFFLGNKMN